MQIDIQEKLRLIIRVGVTEEAEVVYVLAGIRKILEQQNCPERFKVLRFHCDWALHSRLRGTPAQDVLKILEPLYSCLLRQEEVPDNLEACHLSKMDLFKEALSAFLQEFTIDDFTKQGNDWVRFIYLYSRVVEDCPLVIRADNPSNIASVVLSVLKADALIEDHQPYKVNWDFEGKEGFPRARWFILNSYQIDDVSSQ